MRNEKYEMRLKRKNYPLTSHLSLLTPKEENLN